MLFVIGASLLLYIGCAYAMIFIEWTVDYKGFGTSGNLPVAETEWCIVIPHSAHRAIPSSAR